MRPRDEASLVQLVDLAREIGLTLVPRGAATAGYGGAIPAEGAVVVDMRRWKRVLAVDAEAQTVTVEAGVVWKDLEPVLAEHDLALRLYPTSLPASTVAGWLAQGGSGHGSYQYGWFSQNVVSARVVLPTGEVRTVLWRRTGHHRRRRGHHGLHHPGDPARPVARRRQPVRRVVRRREDAWRRAERYLGGGSSRCGR